MATMFYYPEENRRPRKVAALATAVYFLVMALFFIFVSFGFSMVDDSLAGGLVIDFGNSETGWGEQDPARAEADQRTTPLPSNPDDILTQNFEEAPVVTPRENTTPEPSRPTEPVQPTVDRRALFPGQSESNAASEGETGGTGNQGRTDGVVGGARTDGGGGAGTGTYSLSGRRIIGSLPEPEYRANEQGRVVIEVRVNQQGQVTSATFRSNGSTTTNHILVQAAERAALRAVFNVDEEAPFTQIGTITYNFRMQ